ncbi:MAG: Smr/MutS family protein [Gemmatimonadota bacterium]|nr:Smr/MutS family protein [Gemmatimonadota bacterium]
MVRDRYRNPGDKPGDALRRALDEAEFGRERTLNLRASLPTPADAIQRVDAWLRERQVAHAGQVLIITGRGNQSYEGISVVRAAVAKRLISLRRHGVIESFREHTPGSFVATLAPLTALRDAPLRRAEWVMPRLVDPVSLSGLEPATRSALRELARSALGDLGVQDPEPFIQREMVEQFSLIAAGVPDGADRENRLRRAIEGALQEYEDSE